jgi:transcriptional regulator with XRE-family HTH domain
MSTTTTTTVLRFAETEERAQKQAAFRKQFSVNLNVALDRRGAIPLGYGRVVGAAELFGVSQNTAASWIKGEGVPELSRLPEIAEILGTTVEQLVVGDRDTGTKAIDERYVMVDMHEDEGVGGYSWYTLPETLRSLGLPNDIKMLLVKNDDMAPFVGSGEVVIYDPRVKRILSSGVFVLRIGEQLVVRRVQRGVRQNIRLICDNPLFDDEVLDETDFSDTARGGNNIFVAGQVIGRMLLGS